MVSVMYDLQPSTLQTWLEWAGVRLIAMPGKRIGPAEPGVCWPDYEQDPYEVLYFRGLRSIRISPPTPSEIPIIDEILSLPNTCNQITVRRVLHCRALIHPIRGTNLYPWTRVAELLDVKVYTVKRWHRQGLEEASVKAPPEKICRIRAFLSLPTSST